MLYFFKWVDFAINILLSVPSTFFDHLYIFSIYLQLSCVIISACHTLENLYFSHIISGVETFVHQHLKLLEGQFFFSNSEFKKFFFSNWKCQYESNWIFILRQNKSNERPIFFFYHFLTLLWLRYFGLLK